MVKFRVGQQLRQKCKIKVLRKKNVQKGRTKNVSKIFASVFSRALGLKRTKCIIFHASLTAKCYIDEIEGISIAIVVVMASRWL